jgi:hypothetical protein
MQREVKVTWRLRLEEQKLRAGNRERLQRDMADTLGERRYNLIR